MASTEITRKIRGLFDKAAATENDHERETFIAHANRLAAKHSVTEAMLAEAKPAESREAVQFSIDLPERYNKLYGYLAYYVAQGFEAQSILDRGRRRRGYATINIVAMPEQVELIKTVYSCVATEMTRGLDGPGSVNYKNNYGIAFGNRIKSRIADELVKAREEYEAEHDVSTALVTQSAAEKARAKYRELHPRTRTVRSQSGYNPRGASKGVSHADDIDLGARGRLGR